MSGLRLAYLALALGLLAFGGVWAGLGLAGRAAPPPGLRTLAWTGLLVAAAGLVAAIVMEHRGVPRW